MTKDKVAEAVAKFTQNPRWKAYYEDAPSDACKRFIALTFVYSLCGKDEARKEERAGLEELSAVAE